MVREQAKTAADIEVMHLPEPKNFADSLFSSMFESAIAKAPDAAAARALLAAWAGGSELLAVLHEALTADGTMRVHALLPVGLRVR